MRWFLRRLVFYVFAVWVALTLNFLLPRLMPGDPIGGVLQRLSPAQIQSNPGIIQTYQALLGGGKGSIWHDYVVYLHRRRAPRTSASRRRTTRRRSPRSSGARFPYSIVLVGVAFLLAFVLGTAIGMIAAWRRGGGFDTVVVPALMALGAFPAFFTALLGVYFLGLKLALVPDPARLRQRAASRASTGRSSRARSATAQLPVARDRRSPTPAAGC